MWSRSTLVTTATPPSQAWVASRRPPSPTSTSARSRFGLREVAEDHGRQELELRRVAVAPRDPVRDGQDGLDVAGEVVDPDRPAVDDDPLAIRDEVGLGGLADAQPRRAQGAAREGEHAALAVGAGDERPADGELRVTERPEQGAGAPEAHPDPEPAAGGERGEGLVVVEGYGRSGDGGPGSVTRGSARPRRRRTG